MTPNWEDIPEIVRYRLEEHVHEKGAANVAAVLSPFMACEEAWLLTRFVREIAPQAVLAMGPVTMEGEDQHFPVGAKGDAVRFTILKEKCPNRRGVEMVLQAAGGDIVTFEQFTERSGKGDFSAAWIVGGHPKPWVDKKTAKIAANFELLIVQDLFENELKAGAAIVLPSCAWLEREGSFVNAAGLIQSFERAIDPPDGAQRDGQYLYDIAGFTGLYTAERVREWMSAAMPTFATAYAPPELPVHAH
jgi:predicted molibdopterin-dependent oxidoreductase YjgC